ncbi:MAG TPA: hypothetical protein PLV61_13520 [Parvularculaceae bacterium]|nr:hypothetical protein [Parvularculaceae bacterium]
MTTIHSDASAPIEFFAEIGITFSASFTAVTIAIIECGGSRRLARVRDRFLRGRRCRAPAKLGRVIARLTEMGETHLQGRRHAMSRRPLSHIHPRCNLRDLQILHLPHQKSLTVIRRQARYSLGEHRQLPPPIKARLRGSARLIYEDFRPTRIFKIFSRGPKFFLALAKRQIFRRSKEKRPRVVYFVLRLRRKASDEGFLRQLIYIFRAPKIPLKDAPDGALIGEKRSEDYRHARIHPTRENWATSARPLQAFSAVLAIPRLKRRKFSDFRRSGVYLHGCTIFCRENVCGTYFPQSCLRLSALAIPAGRSLIPAPAATKLAKKFSFKAEPSYLGAMIFIRKNARHLLFRSKIFGLIVQR